MLPQQLFRQPEIPNRLNTFMEKVGWSALSAIFSGVIVFAATVWLGNIHILNLDWLMLGLGFIMVFVAIFFVWYSHRTRVLLQNKYNDDIAALRKDFYALQQNFVEMANNEFNRLNSMFVDYTLANAKEQSERLEEMKKQLIEKIMDAENGMDSGIKNALSIFSGSVKSYEVAVDIYMQHYIQIEKRMGALEEQLRKTSSSES